MKVLWTELAVEKLEEYGDYIAQDNPSAALKWTNSIRKSANNLLSFPKLGRVVPEFKRNDIREIIEGDYRVIYHVDKSLITIMTIRHAKQLLREKDTIKK